MHSNVTIKSVSWPHFSWAILYTSAIRLCVCHTLNNEATYLLIYLYVEREVTVSASPSQLKVRVGVDAVFVCRIDGELATSRQLRWSRPVGVTPLSSTAYHIHHAIELRNSTRVLHGKQ